MTLPKSITLCAVLLLPGTAVLAQPARNANRWDGQAHQPTAGSTHARESQAGVAPSDQHARQQDRDLNAIGKQLTDRAGQDAKIPGTANTYGVQPGGVVPIAPLPQSPGPPLSGQSR